MIKLVKLRNPLGNKNWEGEWSDKDSKWNDKSLRDMLNYNINNDGIFFMKYDDFLNYF